MSNHTLSADLRAFLALLEPLSFGTLLRFWCCVNMNMNVKLLPWLRVSSDHDLQALP